MGHKYNTVVIEISFEPELADQLYALRVSPVLENAENIHLVYVHKAEHPDEEDFASLEKQLLLKIEDFKTKIIPHVKRNNCITKCIFSNNLKIAAKEYLETIEPDIIINATHSSHDIDRCFSESFSNYLVRHAPCDVFILRPKKKVA